MSDDRVHLTERELIGDDRTTDYDVLQEKYFEAVADINTLLEKCEKFNDLTILRLRDKWGYKKKKKDDAKY